MEASESRKSEDRLIVEARFSTVRLSSLRATPTEALALKVAGLNLQVSFDPSWAAEVAPLCRAHWQAFRANGGGGGSAPAVPAPPGAEIVLAPADGVFIDAENPVWNEAEPFQFKVDDPTGTWIFHRDFTCLQRGRRYHAWLPKPTLEFTDALDNVVALAARPLAEKLKTFLFHSAIVEHEGRAVVFFGPSGIGKSTLAKLCSSLGLRVMGSDQSYLRIHDGRLWAHASPTCNPDIPRTARHWATEPLEVKALFALQRGATPETGAQVQKVDRVEMVRRIFAEVFYDPTDADFNAALAFASDLAMLPGLKQASLSYPLGHDFWPRLREMGYL